MIQIVIFYCKKIFYIYCNFGDQYLQRKYILAMYAVYFSRTLNPVYNDMKLLEETNVCTDKR